MRPTLADIARAARVSPATVDRVINGRDGVRPGTRDRVLGAARRIGYLPDAAPEAAAGSAARAVRLHVLLPGGTNAFIDNLSDQIRRQAAAMPGVSAAIDSFAALDPDAMASRLAALEGRTDGVALVAVDHPAVREAIRGLVRAGSAVVTLVSDIHSVPRLAYVGIDNGQAGRLAGYVMGRFLDRDRPARIAFFAGTLSYRGHQEREMGFRQVLTDDFSHLTLVARREVREDRDCAHAETLALLDRHPHLAAIYNAGGATSGIARALKARGRDREIVLIAHEATAGNRALLLDGTLDAVIDQNPLVEAREALLTLAGAARGAPHGTIVPRLQIVLRENLPDE